MSPETADSIYLFIQITAAGLALCYAIYLNMNFYRSDVLGNPQSLSRNQLKGVAGWGRVLMTFSGAGTPMGVSAGRRRAAALAELNRRKARP